jgi:hypothetical protein
VNKIQSFSKKTKPKRSSVYDTYWKFAAERQEVFFNRINNQNFPWTNDNVLNQFKFTNAYRAADRVSQYLIKNIIYAGDQNHIEILFRILLFKIFNKIETWEALERYLGVVTYKDYNYKIFDKILGDKRKQGVSIYSAAYIMASAGSAYNYPLKHQNHLKLIEEIMQSDLPVKIGSIRNLESLYNHLLLYPSIGPFLAYQYAIDINYSSLTNFSEMEFVKAGPGAKDGIRKCFSDLGEYSEEDIIKMMADDQYREFEKLDLSFKTLWGRPLQLIDCQNLFCEVDKYLRVVHPEVQGISSRKRIKQKYKPSFLKRIEYFFPEKWNLDYRSKY